MKTSFLFLTTFISFWLMENNPGESIFQSQKKVEFKLVRTFGAEEKPREALLTKVIKITSDNKGNLYLIEKGRLLSFKPDGSLRWVINKQGKGPGDINYPYGIATDGEKYLYIDNVRMSRIDKFDLNGKYVNSTNVSNIKLDQIAVAGFIAPNLLVVTRYPKIIGADIYILDLNNKLQIKNHFIVDETGNTKLYNNPGMQVGVFVNGNKMTTGNYAYYKLGEYDVTGKQTKIIKRDFKKLVIYSAENRLGTYSYITPLFRISKSYYLCGLFWIKDSDNLEKLFGTKDKREFESMIDIYDEKGSIIYSAPKEKQNYAEIEQPIYSDSEGYLYAYKEMPYPQICKYQVIISDKK
jgi:hypothetical protein